MRRIVPAERDECHMLAAERRDPAASDHAVRVRREHHLEQHRRWVGRCALRVVPVMRIEGRQVELVVNQIVERVLERARQELPRQVHRQELRLRVDVLVAGHGRLDGRKEALHIQCTFHPGRAAEFPQRCAGAEGFPTPSLDDLQIHINTYILACA